MIPSCNPVQYLVLDVAIGQHKSFLTPHTSQRHCGFIQWFEFPIRHRYNFNFSCTSPRSLIATNALFQLDVLLISCANWYIVLAVAHSIWRLTYSQRCWTNGTWGNGTSRVIMSLIAWTLEPDIFKGSVIKVLLNLRQGLLGTRRKNTIYIIIIRNA